MLVTFDVAPSTTHSFFFFFNDTATTEIYTLSLHDALPIWRDAAGHRLQRIATVHRCSGLGGVGDQAVDHRERDRKSTRLNSSHLVISYAVFCLKKKKKSSHLDREFWARRQKQHGRR